MPDNSAFCLCVYVTRKASSKTRQEGWGKVTDEKPQAPQAVGQAQASEPESEKVALERVAQASGAPSVSRYGDMNHREYIAEREARDPEFRELREATRPQFEFRRALILVRLDAGLTQRQMAERLGVKEPELARWEAGMTMPTLDTLYRLAKALNLVYVIRPDSPHAVSAYEARESRPGVEQSI